MEEPIGKFCKTAAKFCNHLQTSCAALKESVDRRPIPLDSASTTFVKGVNRRVSAAGDDLNMLESMSFATVSFEELLGHCNEVLKKNQNDIYALQDHLRSSSNYIPPLDFDEENAVDHCELDDFSSGSSNQSKSNDIAEEDHLFDDSLSLKNFGISDVSLATIASQCGESDINFEMDEPDYKIETTTGGLDQYEEFMHLLNVSRDDYENLPKLMKGLVSWEEIKFVHFGLSSIHLLTKQPDLEIATIYDKNDIQKIRLLEDLLVAVEKINSYIATKKIKPVTFRQDEIELLELGYKARSYLLVLIKMNRLSIETNEGVIAYRVL